MSQGQSPDNLDKQQQNLSGSCHFKVIQAPTLTTGSLRLGSQFTPSLDRIEPHIVLLNEKGLYCLSEDRFEQALPIFKEAQKLLEMGASCGKSIDRQLILTVLTNEAFVYQQMKELDLAIKYIEAVIFNISSYLNNPLQVALASQLKLIIQSRPSQEVNSFLKQNGSAVKTFLNRSYGLSVFQLYFAWLLAQTAQNEACLQMAQNAISSMVEHLQFCSILQKYSSQGRSHDFYRMIQQVIQSCFQLQNTSVQKWQIQVEEKMPGQLNLACDAFDRKKLTRLCLKDFLMIKPQQHRSQLHIEKERSIKDILAMMSSRSYIDKFLTISNACYLISQSSAKQSKVWQSKQKDHTYLLGTQEQLKQIMRALQLKSQLYLLAGMNIAFSCIPIDSSLSAELLDVFRVRFNKSLQMPQSYQIQVKQVTRPEQSDKYDFLWEGHQLEISDLAQKPTTNLAPPTFQMNVLDLSAADSVDLNSNASMVDMLKESNKGIATEGYDDSEMYFDFMPKKVKNEPNPLFQATNLQLLLTQPRNSQQQLPAKDQTISFDEGDMIEVQTKPMMKESMKKIEQLVTKIDDEDRQFLKQMIKEKEGLVKKVKKDKLIHSTSANSIYLSRKDKSKKKNPELKTLQFLRMDYKSPNLQKKTLKLNAKPNPQNPIKLNKVKSPLSKLKTDKVDRVLVTKDKKSNNKSKSKEKSIKVSKSKSKSTGKKKIEPNKPKSKFVPIYWQPKK